MEFREVPFGSDDYRRMLTLRENVLRKPLGRTLTETDVAGEDTQFHFCIVGSDGHLAACCVAKRLSDDEIKIRHVATSEQYRGTGLGLVLMRELENALVDRGFTRFQLDSRKHVYPFYLKAGFEMVGDDFDLIGIPHVRMVKVAQKTECHDSKKAQIASNA